MPSTSPLSSLGSRTPSPPPGMTATNTEPTPASIQANAQAPKSSDHIDFSNKPSHKRKRAAAPMPSSAAAQSDANDNSDAPTASVPPIKHASDSEEDSLPPIDQTTGLPQGYTAGQPTELDLLVAQRDEYLRVVENTPLSSQLYDLGVQLVSAAQDKVNTWVQHERIEGITEDVKELAAKVEDMDDGEVAKGEQRIAVLKEAIKEYERSVAARKETQAAMAANQAQAMAGGSEEAEEAADGEMGEDVQTGDGANGDEMDVDAVEE